MPIDGGAARPLQPPSELSDQERETFTIVATVRAGHFRESDARLIGLYVQSLTLARLTGERLAAELGDATPALLKAYDAATRRTCSLATKLRLTPHRDRRKKARGPTMPRVTRPAMTSPPPAASGAGETRSEAPEATCHAQN